MIKRFRIARAVHRQFGGTFLNCWRAAKLILAFQRQGITVTVKPTGATRGDYTTEMNYGA